jgi:hypothetical protein
VTDIDLEGRHQATRQILRWFDADHLPEPLRATSEACGDLARRMVIALPDGPELTVGLRHLLDAKDAFVRQAIVSRDGPRLDADGTGLSKVYPAGGMQPVGQVPAERT